ncbi:fungal specific transcription factor domain protein [Ophiostoma piceae UAMH 11346]|uniref:Fungal specific transcription factor domain protein n=1 Tax=Ophiostoma piceae (strain UAMH 11346) TaxID=1262450 RepID=S3BTW2_OPHP1|nr:fungal specific transcription factor domain protein [Ophiostoma piceae UAMH 11346]
MESHHDASPPAHQAVMKHACTSCSRRKIRCDRRQPCTNCVSHAKISARKAGSKDKNKNTAAAIDCVYDDPPPVQRYRRRAMPRPSAPADDLVGRLRVYEDLLQKNNIALPDMFPKARLASQNVDAQSITSDTDAADRLWIASPWESRMPQPTTSASASAAETPSSAADTLAFSEVAAETGSLPSASNGEELADDELDLWQSLAPELRNLPVSSVFARRFFGYKPGASSLHPTASITAGLLGVPGPAEPVQHPDPRIILRLWQVFIDNVNPIIRIVHVPTTSQQVLDASWDAAHAPPAIGALLFSIYALSLTSLSAADFAGIFPAGNDIDAPVPDKSELLARYRTGAMQCLVAAGLLTTRRVDVLRAFTLLILAEPDSELASSLASLAVHLGLKMGLHREPSCAQSPSSVPGLSFFEREMRVRLWWQIRGINTRMRQAVNLSLGHSQGNTTGSDGDSGTKQSSGSYITCGMQPASEVIEIRLPLNVNDADLHPDMTSPPVEHTGPTEMMYVRMKYETALWMRSFAQKRFISATATGREPDHVYRSQVLPALKYEAINDLEKMYTDGCLRHCDARIPLHAVTAHMARMAVAQLRFQAYHPRVTAVSFPESPEVSLFTRQNSDTVFKHALDILETCFTCRHVSNVGRSFVAFQLLADIVMRVVMDALVYVVCMLRVRTGHARKSARSDELSQISTAWRLIEIFYDEYGEDMAAAIDDYQQYLSQGPENRTRNEEELEEERRLATGAAFVTALTDLVLQSWGVRLNNATLGESIQEPAYISRLQEQRQKQQAYLEGNNTSLLPDHMDSTALVFQEEQFMDWGHWNNLIQI